MSNSTNILIDKGKQFLMLKIMTPPSVSFFDEHQKLIQENGFVWFCRFGKCNLVINSIDRDGNYIFIKESIKNGNGRYLLEFEKISQDPPAKAYPAYYEQVTSDKPLWFKVTAIHKVDNSFESHFRLASSGNTLDGVYRSMCNSFYITCCDPYIIK